MNNLDKQYTNLLQDIQVTKSNLLEKFPNVSYTVRILMWDDNTKCIECSHTDEDDKKHISKMYNGTLSYETINITGKVMILNKFGEEEYYTLTKD
jgi:hypothetical protein